VYATTIKNIDPNVGTTIYPWPDDGIYQLVGSADIGDLIDYAVRHPYPPRIDPGSIKQDVTETKALLSSAGMDHVNLLMTEYSQDWGATNDAMSWTNAILQARLEMNMLANPDISGYYEFDLFQCAKLIYSNTDFWTARRYYADANRPTDDHPELGARYVKLPSGLVGGMFDNLAYDDIVKLWPGKNSDVYALMSNSDQGHKILLLNTSSSSIPLNWSSSFNVGSISTLTSTGEQFSHTLTQPWSINADPNSGINPNLVLAPKSMMLLTENPVLVKASLPTPANSGTGVSITPTLNWTGGGMLADSHDVYFGTNQTDVNNATTASAEFKGNQGGTTYVPETLSNNTTYYWRVDERHAAVVDDFEEGTLNLTKWTDESFGGGTATVTNGRLTVQSNGDYNNGQVRSKSTATIQNASETLVLSSTNVSMNDWGIGSSFGLSDASGNNQIRIGTLYSAGNRYFGVEVVVDGISQQDLIRSPSYITSSYTITWAAGKVTVQSQLYGLMFDSSDPNKNGGTAAWSLPAMGTQMAVLVFGSYQSGWTSLEDVKLAVSSDFTKGDVWSFTTETPPTFVAAGAVTSGTVTITPSLPASITTGDILLLFIETSNQAVSISNQNGGTWTQITNSPQYTGTAAGTTGVRLAAYWSRYNGTQGNPTISDSGNHQMGRIIAIRGAAASGDPWNVTAGGVEAASDTSGSIPGATTTATSTLVVVAIASALPDATGTSNFSNWINTDMASLTERTDNTVIAGNGGGIGIATDVMATAGAYSNTVVTLGSSSYKAMMSIAIKP
jgi:hypothetical protein